MFGYVVVNKPELKIKDFDTYRAYYCGLCKALKERAGARGQMSLSYDMTFLAVLLSLLYEPEETEGLSRCIVHPVTKHRMKKNAMIDYVADMNLLLTRYKCKDDFWDEKNVVKACYGTMLNGPVKKIQDTYERQTKQIEKYLAELAALEKECNYDIDKLSGCFGHLLEEIFVVKQDEWEPYLRKIGFYIGKFVYVIDAYDDLEKDKKKGCFNPFIEKEKEENFDEWVKQLLLMIAAEFAREFEKLPIVDNVDILRNIIYSGIWVRYEEVRKKRNQTADQNNEENEQAENK